MLTNIRGLHFYIIGLSLLLAFELNGRDFLILNVEAVSADVDVSYN